jgi:hypothetical protein
MNTARNFKHVRQVEGRICDLLQLDEDVLDEIFQEEEELSSRRDSPIPIQANAHFEFTLDESVQLEPVMSGFRSPQGLQLSSHHHSIRHDDGWSSDSTSDMEEDSSDADSFFGHDDANLVQLFEEHYTDNEQEKPELNESMGKLVQCMERSAVSRSLVDNFCQKALKTSTSIENEVASSQSLTPHDSSVADVETIVSYVESRSPSVIVSATRPANAPGRRGVSRNHSTGSLKVPNVAPGRRGVSRNHSNSSLNKVSNAPGRRGVSRNHSNGSLNKVSNAPGRRGVSRNHSNSSLLSPSSSDHLSKSQHVRKQPTQSKHNIRGVSRVSSSGSLRGATKGHSSGSISLLSEASDHSRSKSQTSSKLRMQGDSDMLVTGVNLNLVSASKLALLKKQAPQKGESSNIHVPLPQRGESYRSNSEVMTTSSLAQPTALPAHTSACQESYNSTEY